MKYVISLAGNVFAAGFIIALSIVAFRQGESLHGVLDLAMAFGNLLFAGLWFWMIKKGGAV